MSKELNIKSSTIEKGLEMAKEFAGKLLGPSVEELGLLISDNLKYIRYKNQVRILLKAKDYVEKRNIKTSEIPVKILVPLLEKASLEENEELQDKWAKMITNLCDSKTNLQNQIFPYILSQISKEEYNGLSFLYRKEREFQLLKLKYYNSNLDENEITNTEKDKMKDEFSKIYQKGFLPELDHFELSNLERLGLINRLPPAIIIEEFKSKTSHGFLKETHELEAEYDPENYGFRITKLGEKFKEICELKTKEKPEDNTKA